MSESEFWQLTKQGFSSKVATSVGFILEGSVKVCLEIIPRTIWSPSKHKQNNTFFSSVTPLVGHDSFRVPEKV